jgi:hypothetical protein
MDVAFSYLFVLSLCLFLLFYIRADSNWPVAIEFNT